MSGTQGDLYVSVRGLRETDSSSLPNLALHRSDTTECKPIVQSRDTQELPGDGGRQALRLLSEFPSRTTLLQDWIFYENQSEEQQQPANNGGEGAKGPQALAPNASNTSAAAGQQVAPNKRRS